MKQAVRPRNGASLLAERLKCLGDGFANVLIGSLYLLRASPAARALQQSRPAAASLGTRPSRRGCDETGTAFSQQGGIWVDAPGPR